jgi:glutamine amidotransferase
MIAIVDYGMGNLQSVLNAFQSVAPNLNIQITSDPKKVDQADRVVFPGQGAMPDCIKELEKNGLKEAVVGASKNKPFLGICIGLQMLFDESEEGNINGLSVFDGIVKKFKPNNHFNKIPHMGWNQVNQVKNHYLWNGIANNERFYFVHSYYVDPLVKKNIVATTNYETNFCSAVARENIFAVQFHPEKSAKSGLQLLKNFTSWRI